jgi:hypothetical protein
MVGFRVPNSEGVRKWIKALSYLYNQLPSVENFTCECSEICGKNESNPNKMFILLFQNYRYQTTYYPRIRCFFSIFATHLITIQWSNHTLWIEKEFPKLKKTCWHFWIKFRGSNTNAH